MTMTRTRSPIELFWTAKECFPFHLSILSFEVWRESYVLSAFHPDGKLLTKLTRSFFTDLLTIKSFFFATSFQFETVLTQSIRKTFADAGKVGARSGR